MNENIIKFNSHPIFVADKEIHPEPAKFNIPEWYKNVPNPQEYGQLTIKACKPFLDSLTAGYILKNPVDQKINFNVYNEEKGKKGTWIELSRELKHYEGLFNINSGKEVHPIGQVGGMSCPYAKTNLGYPIYKILNPWTIVVPRGYSVLYLPPINRPDNRFEVMSGIVDGEVNIPTNFPCVFKKEGSWILKKGTPIASVFPFKIEKWKLRIEEKSHFDKLNSIWKYGSVLTRWYQDYVWNKKIWK